MMLDPARYKVDGYAAFRARALDPSLSPNEKCGFSEVFRAGMSSRILADISAKLLVFGKPGGRICDIGAGCSELSHLIIETTGKANQRLTVIDCPEMLALLPSPPHLTKIEGPFPECVYKNRNAMGLFDGILVYSVLQTVFAEGNLFAFVDAAVQLLSDQGQLLLGDIPNASMRRRFMASEMGKAYHKDHYGHLAEPDVVSNSLTPNEIDDGIILDLIARLRSAGFHTFVMPQAVDLPMANRREDLLVVRP